MENNMQSSNLIGFLKVTSQNIRMLHRHLSGGNWNGDHILLGDYYEEIDEMEDSVVEMLMSAGYDDVPITEALHSFKLLETRDYSAPEAFSLVKAAFVKLIKFIEAAENELELNSGIVSELDNYVHYLQIEGNYKLTRYLADKNLDAIFNPEEKA